MREEAAAAERQMPDGLCPEDPDPYDLHPSIEERRRAGAVIWAALPQAPSLVPQCPEADEDIGADIMAGIMAGAVVQ